MIELVYETHSTSTHNEAGIATGWLDGELSEHGREQARALGDRRRDDGLAVVYTSDLRRAIETADIAFAGRDLTRRQDPRLRECNYGELNGHPVAEIDALRPSRVDEPYPGGESYRDVVARTRLFLTDLLAERDGARVLVIAHAANRWSLQHLLGGEPLEQLVAAPFEWQEGWEYALDGELLRRG
ncbi:MAG TPA: histidine phosphatase family protein [Gaiellaceae bacterium]|jgi:broad specificity phosphatase PhoE